MEAPMRILDLAIAAGFARPARMDMAAFLEAVRREPDCASLTGQTIRNYIRGKSQPRGRVLLGIARVLGCEPADLFGDGGA
jgi:transcriptional regulator with XRE-family HTH domain